MNRIPSALLALRSLPAQADAGFVSTIVGKAKAGIKKGVSKAPSGVKRGWSKAKAGVK